VGNQTIAYNGTIATVALFPLGDLEGTDIIPGAGVVRTIEVATAASNCVIEVYSDIPSGGGTLFPLAMAGLTGAAQAVNLATSTELPTASTRSSPLRVGRFEVQTADRRFNVPMLGARGCWIEITQASQPISVSIEFECWATGKERLRTATKFSSLASASTAPDLS
jgi:hypothetical protein